MFTFITQHIFVRELVTILSSILTKADTVCESLSLSVIQKYFLLSLKTCGRKINYFDWPINFKKITK